MKILFFAEAVSFAHIGRPLVLARWAHENGVEVHFASSPEGLQKTNANSFGFATHSIYTIEGSLFYDRANHGKFFYQKSELKKYVEERVEEITNGEQQPTSRQETMEVDWKLR